MTTDRRGRAARFPLGAARFPFRAVAALAALAAVLLTAGFTTGTALVPTAPAPATAPFSPASPSPATYSTDTRPYSDDAYVGARTLLARPERDTGERTGFAGPLPFTAAHTPPIPPRPARPAPVAGHAPPAAAHMPFDPGRAPPTASST
ncbi:hypothetical protein [Streptomyces griseoloalbus]|uniref:Uncharacterized protein n=1 Tax=Streptomyces griseoloalbus TaxID=67303 RepID=A0A7W8BLV0_9ACTN|nr:hypothetical protein [Streptomyces albaduncus]MBB5125670.1 hypothetical protein [Streptomyces albaduncus]GGW56084.1 hypothetical protein GCM10010340_38370 [Streptomyces albaduncus]